MITADRNNIGHLGSGLSKDNCIGQLTADACRRMTVAAAHIVDVDSRA